MSHTAYICKSHTDTCGNIPIDILTRAIDRCSREVSLFPESGREPSRRKMNNLTISRTHTHTLCIYTATGMRNYYFIYFENVRVGWGVQAPLWRGKGKGKPEVKGKGNLRDKFTIAESCLRLLYHHRNTSTLMLLNPQMFMWMTRIFCGIILFEDSKIWDMSQKEEKKGFTIDIWWMGPAGTRRAQAMFAPACKRNENFIVLMDGKHEALRRCLHLLAQPVPIGRLMILVVWFSGSFSSRHHRLWKFTTFSISGGPSSNFSRRQKIFLWTSGKIV